MRDKREVEAAFAALGALCDRNPDAPDEVKFMLGAQMDLLAWLLHRPEGTDFAVFLCFLMHREAAHA